MGKNAGSGTGMNYPDLISESLETNFWETKILEFFNADTGWKNPDPGYGREKILIRETSRIRNTGFYYCWSLPSAVYVCDVPVSSGAVDPVVADVLVPLMVPCLEFLLMLESSILLASFLFMAYLFF
jgi:hypothetical protein